MNKKSTIDLFITKKSFAMAGVSRDHKKFGNTVFRILLNKGYNITPINPRTNFIDDILCYRSVLDLPGSVKSLLIVTHKFDTEYVVKDAIQKGIENIWIQNGCESNEALELIKKTNINVVTGKCILMYADPKGVHKFHQVLAKCFGTYVNS